MEYKTITLTRGNVRQDVWESFCYYLGLIGNYENEPDADHFKSIEVTINKVEEL